MDVRAKFVSPNIKSTSFNCPHCGALASQNWRSITAQNIGGLFPLPKIKSFEDFNEINKLMGQEIDEKRCKEYPFIVGVSGPARSGMPVENIFISVCYSCDEITIWLCDRILWPELGVAPLPNPDLPSEIRVDYLEASSILDKSPRGAAALLRLVIQKLCTHLGEESDNLNNAIGALVKKGLPERIQRALDTVRVIGNNMVHPGKMDIEDDRAVAETLFKLVNLIVEKMISEEKELTKFIILYLMERLKLLRKEIKNNLHLVVCFS
ncbi:MAG: DUF4145 domain-containing protein [Rhodomicrobiaceae bacterium]